MFDQINFINTLNHFKMNRRFTVVDTRTNSTKTFSSTANTLGELKADMRREGINPDGMAIQEGLTKTELRGDDSTVLPHDVPYKGGTTNNLVFRLTQTEKRIKSGAMTRSEVFDEVKRLGLAPKIQEKYGKNFTQCTTSLLISEIEEAKCHCNQCCNAESTSVEDVAAAVAKLTHILIDDEVICEEDGQEVIGLLGAEVTEESDYSADEITNMFKDMD